MRGNYIIVFETFAQKSGLCINVGVFSSCERSFIPSMLEIDTFI